MKTLGENVTRWPWVRRRTARARSHRSAVGIWSMPPATTAATLSGPSGALRCPRPTARGGAGAAPVTATLVGPMPEAVVASFNLHSGVDGWGRPYDVVGACRRIDADVLVLLESWVPAAGPGLADQVATALGYESYTHPVRTGRLVTAHPSPGPGWKPRYGHLDGPKLV